MGSNVAIDGRPLVAIDLRGAHHHRRQQIAKGHDRIGGLRDQQRVDSMPLEHPLDRGDDRNVVVDEEDGSYHGVGF